MPCVFPVWGLFCVFFFPKVSVSEELIKEQQEDSNEDISILPIEGIKKFNTAKIPRTKPLTRQQFVEAQKHWSCNFHEDKQYDIQITLNTTNHCFCLRLV